MSLFDEGNTRGQVVTVRPGRRLFVRRIVLGSHRPADESSSTTGPPTLVFVHGSCATERQYHRLVKALQVDHDHDFPVGTTCLLYDLAGCGQSPPPTRARDNKDEEGDRPEKLGWVRQSWESLLRVQDGALYSNGESIHDLRAIISTHCGRRGSSADGAATPLFLVGHSYASNLILPLALELSVSADKGDVQVPVPVPPHSVTTISGVILLSCGARTPGNPIPDGGSPLIRNVPVPVLNCMQPSLTSGFVSAAVHPDNSRTDPDVVEDMVEYCNANRMEVVRAYHSQMKWFSLAPPSPSTQPSQPSTPVEFRTAGDAGVRALILHGDHDNIIPIQVGQEIANALRQELVVVRNASHMIMMERPVEVASHVRNFVVGRS